jgi:hypothetical protein
MKVHGSTSKVGASFEQNPAESERFRPVGPKKSPAQLAGAGL